MLVFSRLRYTLSRFMTGRYGSDSLNQFLLLAYMVLWAVSLFFRRGVVGWILYALTLALVVVVFFRMLSRNVSHRQRENVAFLRLRGAVTGFLRRQLHRLRDIRRWRYRRCPYCRADLRLPIRRGRRTVTCSRCQGAFKAFFL